MTIEEIKEQIAKLQREVDRLEKQEKWVPELNERYWHVTTGGNPRCWTWDNDDIDSWRYLSGNYFKTRKEAEEHKKKLEVYFKFKNFVESRNKEINWEDGKELKYGIYYDWCAHSIAIMENWEDMCQGVIYASSKQILEDALEYIGGEKVAKRYLFGIKE